MVNAVVHLRHGQSTMAGMFAGISTPSERHKGQTMTGPVISDVADRCREV
jgi:hypothetical protein